MLNYLIIVVLFVGKTVGTSSVFKIVNGTDAIEGEFPYLVSIQKSNKNSHFCCGSILDETHILTAAHCIYRKKPNYKMQIQYGTIKISSKKNRIPVLSHFHHKDYKEGNGFLNDIAILTLARPIKYSSVAQPVVLPKPEEPPVYGDSVIAGWGRLNFKGKVPKILQRINVYLLQPSLCNKFHKNYFNNYHVCAGGGDIGTCQGDSGGPLCANGTQVGVVSWNKTPCAKYPTVYTKVSHYTNWIKNQLHRRKQQC